HHPGAPTGQGEDEGGVPGPLRPCGSRASARRPDGRPHQHPRGGGMSGVRVVSLALCGLMASGCGVFGPKSRPYRPRVLTARPDPNVACGCKVVPKRLRFTSVSPVGVALCGGGTTLADPTPSLACGTLYVGGGSPETRALHAARLRRALSR